MLQEEQTVTFQPMYEVYVPWYVRLFYLYLAITVLLALVRSARVFWSLRTQKIASRRSESFLHLHSPDSWDHSYVKARSLKTLSHLTFLISMIALLWSLADDLTQAATQKTAGIGAVAGGLADTLRTFSSGIVVSAALLCTAVLCERLIRRRKLGMIRARSEPDEQ